MRVYIWLNASSFLFASCLRLFILLMLAYLLQLATRWTRCISGHWMTPYIRMQIFRCRSSLSSTRYSSTVHGTTQQVNLFCPTRAKILFIWNFPIRLPSFREIIINTSIHTDQRMVQLYLINFIFA